MLGLLSMTLFSFEMLLHVHGVMVSNFISPSMHASRLLSHKQAYTKMEEN
jgi:hypothetical protein